jgi:hypothetical protein
MQRTMCYDIVEKQIHTNPVCRLLLQMFITSKIVCKFFAQHHIQDQGDCSHPVKGLCLDLSWEHLHMVVGSTCRVSFWKQMWYWNAIKTFQLVRYFCLPAYWDYRGTWVDTEVQWQHPSDRPLTMHIQMFTTALPHEICRLPPESQDS